MKKIKVFGTQIEANLAKTYLESFGIKCYTQELPAGTHWGIILFIMNPENFERANEILTRYTSDK